MERVFMDRMVHRGYTEVQAREVMDIVQRLRGGQNVRLTPQQSDWVNDINAINARWSEISPSTRRLSQLQPGQVREMFTGMLLAGPLRPAPVIAEVQRPAPVRTFVYDVTVDGNQYRVETRTALASAGMSSVEQSRVGQLRRMLSASPSPILAITTPDGATVRPGTPEFGQFGQAYARAYAAMIRDPESERIAISAVRRRSES
jgi:hypothetical protein